MVSTTSLKHANDTSSHYVLVLVGSMPTTSQEQRSKYLILKKSDMTDFSVEPTHRVSWILLPSARLSPNIPLDQMQARLRLYNAAYLARL